jgi:XTP/dITP diphosphohydrolase
MLGNERLVIASNNANKIREIKAILSGRFAEIVSMGEAGINLDVEETGETFEQNAILKAQAVAREARCWALADDSGICVDALGGNPGVYSARWSGDGDEANNRKMLEEMRGKTDRAARYMCVMALADSCGFLLTAEGRCEGSIGYELKGKRGFGYDPLFIVDGYGCTMAELPDDVKNGISHRKRALEALMNRLWEMNPAGGLSSCPTRTAAQSCC